MKLLNKKYTLLTLLYLALIFIQSSIPSNKIPQIKILSSDKIIHAGIYFIATLLIYLAIREHQVLKSNKIAWMTFIITAVYGITDEIHQYFVQGRDSNIFDFFADVVGILLGLLVVHIFRRKWQIKIKERQKKQQNLPA
ncbi:MAG: VanZ family protein [Candidatus Marinimicrobia bacterium]|nr:VanZ family protein [Candidatus Neomarinimicrobiota bacterium]MDD5582424.1 VanZ family protein [Candidatus Neomarinimicrobiota bacterium]